MMLTVRAVNSDGGEQPPLTLAIGENEATKKDKVAERIDYTESSIESDGYKNELTDEDGVSGNQPLPNLAPDLPQRESTIFSPSEDNLFKDKTAIAIFCYNRPDTLSETLDELLKVLPRNTPMNQENIELFILQDGFDSSITSLLDVKIPLFTAIGYRMTHYQIEQLKDDQINLKPKLRGYAKLSNNYKQQLKHLVTTFPDIKRYIILEDDLLVAPDFLIYFSAVAPLLDKDDSLLAASAWNDNGFEWLVEDNTRLYRTDFFSGLGWMIRSDYLAELVAIWPSEFWDDWLRDNKIRKGRQFIVPEVCRTYNIGLKGGTSGSPKLTRNLKYIKKNTEPVDFFSMNLDFLLESNFDSYFFNDFFGLPTEVSITDLKEEAKFSVKIDNHYIVYYKDPGEFYEIADTLKCMVDARSGVPRQGYRGHVFIRHFGNGLIIAPHTEYVHKVPSKYKQKARSIRLDLRTWEEFRLGFKKL